VRKLELRLNFTPINKFYELYNPGKIKENTAHNSENLKQLQQDFQIPDNFLSIYTIKTDKNKIMTINTCKRIPKGITSTEIKTLDLNYLANSMTSITSLNYFDLPQNSKYPFIEEPINNIYCLYKGENPEQFLNNLIKKIYLWTQ